MINENVKKQIMQEKSVANRMHIAWESGCKVSVRPMGKGGVFQEKTMRNGEYRFQISAGWGRYNYAYCVIL